MRFSSSLLSLCDIHLVGAKEFWPLQLYIMALSIQVLFSRVRLSYRSLIAMESPLNVVHSFNLKIYNYVLDCSPLIYVSGIWFGVSRRMNAR
jgi:hypothetical protein